MVRTIRKKHNTKRIYGGDIHDYRMMKIVMSELRETRRKLAETTTWLDSHPEDTFERLEKQYWFRRMKLIEMKDLDEIEVLLGKITDPSGRFTQGERQMREYLRQKRIMTEMKHAIEKWLEDHSADITELDRARVNTLLQNVERQININAPNFHMSPNNKNRVNSLPVRQISPENFDALVTRLPSLNQEARARGYTHGRRRYSRGLETQIQREDERNRWLSEIGLAPINLNVDINYFNRSVITNSPYNVSGLKEIVLTNNAKNGITFNEVDYTKPVLVLNYNHARNQPSVSNIIYQSKESINSLRKSKKNPYMGHNVRIKTANWMRPIQKENNQRMSKKRKIQLSQNK
jgi:hypothetical protein